MKYWFRPKKFWGWFAAYYPVSAEGWIITLASLTAFAATFFWIDQKSHSISDTLINFAPRAVLIFLVFDITTRLTGEYPSWWKNRWRKRR
jgi:hypothetical protein